MSRTISTRLTLAILVISIVSSPAWARKKKAPQKARTVRVLMLPVKVKGLTAELARPLALRLGLSTVKELRDLKIFEILVGKKVSKKMKELKKKKVMVKGCQDKRKCIRSVGTSFKARILYFMHLAKAQKGVELTVRTFDVRSGKQVREVVEYSTEDLDDLERAARWAARKASSPMITSMFRGKGRLGVDCEEEGAELFLNGKSFGERTNRTFKVGAGVFDVQVKKEGFVTFHDVVVVRARQVQKIRAALEPAEKPAAPMVAAADKPGPEEDKPREERPAWAIYDKPKEPEKPEKPEKPGDLDVRAGPARQTEKAGTTEQARAAPEPFLPGEKKPGQVPGEGLDDESGWYSSWWFWTIVGVAVAGGVGGGLYAGGVFETGPGPTPTGNARFTWD